MPHNERFPVQWRRIKPHVDFAGKKVLDLGCGYGDMVAQCWLEGADVVGFDHHPDVVNQARNNLDNRNIPRSLVWHGDITNLGESWDAERWDIIICFSVLQYLEDKHGMLDWIKSHCDVALLEIQAIGDGPGTQTQREIKEMLKQKWDVIENLGSSVVIYRNMHRHIWMCQ